MSENVPPVEELSYKERNDTVMYAVEDGVAYVDTLDEGYRLQYGLIEVEFDAVDVVVSDDVDAPYYYHLYLNKEIVGVLHYSKVDKELMNRIDEMVIREVDVSVVRDDE